MVINNTRELYIKMLSDVLKREERLTEVFSMLRENAQDSGVKEILGSAMYLLENSCASLDRCFKLIGEKPVASDSKFQDAFVEDLKTGLESIQAPVAKILYIASKVNHLIQLRISELESLVLMSDMNGHPGVSLLLDSVLAQKQVFIDRIFNRIAEVLQGENR